MHPDSPFIGASIALLVVAPSCASYSAQPIDPKDSRAVFEARNLRSTEVGNWLRTSFGSDELFPPTAWGLRDLTVVALHWSAAIELARAHAATALAAVRTVEARPNPLLAPSAKYATQAGGMPWILGLVLDFTLETSGKRALARDAASALARVADVEVLEASWMTCSNVRHALLELVLAQRDVELARADLDVRRERSSIFERRLAVGESSQPDTTAARLATSGAELALLRAEGASLEARARLAAALGTTNESLRNESFFWPAIEDLPPVPDAHAIMRKGLTSRLDVRRELLQYAAREDELRLEIARQWPDVHLAPGFAWDQGQNKYAIGFTFPIPVFNANEGPIAEAEARRRESAERFALVQATASGEIDIALASYRARLASIEAADRELVIARSRLELVQRSFDAGGDDRSTLIDARLEVAAAERARFEAVREARRAQGRLEDALHAPLGDFPPDVSNGNAQP